MQGQYNPGFGVNRVIHKQTPHPPINNWYLSICHIICIYFNKF
jgi:hypothetical protein